MSASTRLAPGSLRSIKIANLEPRTADATDRRSDQGRVWDEVNRQALTHGVRSGTSALDDVQEEMGRRIAGQLERIVPGPDQIGVVCAIGDRVCGLDLFDRASTLGQYLRGIVAGHVLDAPPSPSGPDAFRAIGRFLGQIDSAGPTAGRSVGLGEEILLRGPVAGIGLSYDGHLIHLAAFPAPAPEGHPR